MARRRSRPVALGRAWHDYGLSIVLFTLFAIAFVLHSASGWMQYRSEQEQHGQQATIFGDDGYGWYWAEWTLQNWQSEFLELGVIVVLSSFLIHKGSAESKDSDDEIKKLLESIEKKHVDLIASRTKQGYRALDAIEGHLDGGGPFLVGSSPTLADIALYAYTHVAHEGGFDLSGYPAIGAWLERVAADPGHVTIDA